MIENNHVRFEIPCHKYRNFSNIFGRRTEKKIIRDERVTLGSIMRTDWAHITDNEPANDD